MLSSLFKSTSSTSKYILSSVVSHNYTSPTHYTPTQRLFTTSNTSNEVQKPTEIPITYKDSLLIYEGPLNEPLRKMKRIFAGTLFCFAIVYPVASLGFKIGSATYGMGARIVFASTGILFSSLLFGSLHYFTRGYIVTLRTHKSDSDKWIAEVYKPFGGITEVVIDLNNVESANSKIFLFKHDNVKYFVAPENFFNKKTFEKLGVLSAADLEAIEKEAKEKKL